MEATTQAGFRNESEGRHCFAGMLTARWLVPIYLGLGAFFKIIDGSPAHLPAALIQLAGQVNLDLLYLLRLSIALELAVAGVMLILPRIGRLAGLLLLGVFLPILVGDLLLGASSCGCFGAVAIPPWLTLIMDGGLFAALWYFGGKDSRLEWRAQESSIRVLLAGLWTVAVFMLGFSVGVRAAEKQQDSSGQVHAEAGLASLPEEGYYLPEYENWLGKQWSDIPLSHWIEGIPEAWDPSAGEKYILLYRKDCEHCHALMEMYFSGVLPAPVLAVAVPERNGFPTENLQPFVCGACSLAELPSGVDWFFKTPVLIRLEDGVVGCAAEVSAEDPQCVRF